MHCGTQQRARLATHQVAPLQLRPALQLVRVLAHAAYVYLVPTVGRMQSMLSNRTCRPAATAEKSHEGLALARAGKYATATAASAVADAIRGDRTAITHGTERRSRIPSHLTRPRNDFFACEFYKMYCRKHQQQLPCSLRVFESALRQVAPSRDTRSQQQTPRCLLSNRHQLVRAKPTCNALRRWQPTAIINHR